MSDSEPAHHPSDATLSRTLHRVVIAIHKAGKNDDLTVKRIRTRAEEELGLPVGFFKTNHDWKQRSHDIIHDAVEKYCADDPVLEPKQAASPTKPKPKPKPAPKRTKTASETTRGAKRKSVTPAKKPQKRRKTAVVSDEESDASLSEPPAKQDTPADAESGPPKKPARQGKKVVTEDPDEEEDVPNTPTSKAKGELSESEMSSLIDESPVKKKRQKKSPSDKRGREPKAKAVKATKPKAKSSKSKGEDDPDQAEIKRLQGWLVKCGIRKVWSKELANCDTAKEKIKHLKGMLKDVGMEGKYSNEKAARIKEQREFAKDLEAIQEGARVWGKPVAGEDSGRPRRGLNRGLKRVAIEDEDDDKEKNNGNDDDDVKAETEDDDDDDEVKAETEDDSDGGDESE